MKNLLALFICLVCLFKSPLMAQQADPFTGAFSYGVPLLTVPGPNGEAIPISASYGSGIGVNQQSSEIGLGWGLDAGGMITRTVNGVPDDWNYKETARSDKTGFEQHFGIFYYKNNVPEEDALGDMYESRYKTDSVFRFPNYDAYYLNGAGLNGQLKPHYFNFIKPEQNWGDKKPQFILQGDFADTVNSRHYPWNEMPLTSTSPTRLPTDMINGSTKSFDGGAYNDEDYSEAYNRNRLRTANYVE